MYEYRLVVGESPLELEKHVNDLLAQGYELVPDGLRIMPGYKALAMEANISVTYYFRELKRFTIDAPYMHEKPAALAVA